MVFPITSNVVLPGEDTVKVKTLNRDDGVNCWWCKERFYVSEKTALVVDKYGNAALQCPFCGKKVSVLYYYDEARPTTRKERYKINRKIKLKKEKEAL